MKLKPLFIATLALFSAGVAQSNSNTTDMKSVAHKEQQLDTFKSHYSPVDTVDKIKQALTDKGMKIFTVIDHQAAAKEVGLTMPFTSVIVFGVPKVGTPMMLETPSLAIDLPLKALVWESNGETLVALNDVDVIAKKHNVSKENAEKLKNATKLISKAVSQ